MPILGPDSANSPNEREQGRSEPNEPVGRSAPERIRPDRSQDVRAETRGIGGTPERGPAPSVPPGFRDRRGSEERPIRGTGFWKSLFPLPRDRRAQLNEAFQRGEWSLRPEERPPSPLSRAYGQRLEGEDRTFISQGPQPPLGSKEESGSLTKRNSLRTSGRQLYF